MREGMQMRNSQVGPTFFYLCGQLLPQSPIYSLTAAWHRLTNKDTLAKATFIGHLQLVFVVQGAAPEVASIHRAASPSSNTYK